LNWALDNLADARANPQADPDGDGLSNLLEYALNTAPLSRSTASLPVGPHTPEGYLVRSRTPWYKQEQRQPAPFLCTYMGRSTQDKAPFRFIWNRSAATATNLYLLLTPQHGLAKMLAAHPDRAAWIHEWLSQVTGDKLRGEGRVYRGGLNKIEPKELASISAKQLLAHWPEISSVTDAQGELFSNPSLTNTLVA